MKQARNARRRVGLVGNQPAGAQRALAVRRGPWGYLHARRPEAAQASAVIDSLDELPAALARLGTHRLN